MTRMLASQKQQAKRGRQFEKYEVKEAVQGVEVTKQETILSIILSVLSNQDTYERTHSHNCS